MRSISLKRVVVSAPLASHSPCTGVRMTAQVTGYNDTHISLEVDELKSAAVQLDDLLASFLLISFVDIGARDNGSSVGFLVVLLTYCDEKCTQDRRIKNMTESMTIWHCQWNWVTEMGHPYRA